VMIVTEVNVYTGNIEVVNCSWFNTLHELQSYQFLADLLVRE